MAPGFLEICASLNILIVLIFKTLNAHIFNLKQDILNCCRYEVTRKQMLFITNVVYNKIPAFK